MDFKQQLQNFPKQLEWKPQVENRQNLPKRWSGVLVCGMGGSALPGLLLQSLLPNKNIITYRDCGLPQNITKNTFVIAVSYSGNTEETISAYQKAKKQNVPLALIASGGKLQKLAKKNKDAFVKIPSGIQPRIALGYQFRALVELVNAPKPDKIKPNTEKIAREAKKLAKNIGSSIPLFYASTQNKALAYVAKISINENAKRHSFYNVFPELNHNELEGYETFCKNLFIVFLKDKKDDKRIQNRMELTIKLIEKKGYPVYTFDICGDDWYNRIVCSILFTNWLSYYLAINASIKPEPVDLIEEFKDSLRS